MSDVQDIAEVVAWATSAFAGVEDLQMSTGADGVPVLTGVFAGSLLAFDRGRDGAPRAHVVTRCQQCPVVLETEVARSWLRVSSVTLGRGPVPYFTAQKDFYHAYQLGPRRPAPVGPRLCPTCRAAAAVRAAAS